MSDFEVAGSIEIVKFDGIDSSAVYLGGITRLKNVTDQLEWHVEESSETDVESLTLDEIYHQCRDKFGLSIITVFVDSPLSGRIYQCNNYDNGLWVQYGELRGYA